MNMNYIVERVERLTYEYFVEDCLYSEKVDISVCYENACDDVATEMIESGLEFDYNGRDKYEKMTIISTAIKMMVNYENVIANVYDSIG